MSDFVMIGENAVNLDNVEDINFEYGYANVVYTSGRTKEFHDEKYRALLDFIRGNAPDTMAQDIETNAAQPPKTSPYHDECDGCSARLDIEGGVIWNKYGEQIGNVSNGGGYICSARLEERADNE